MILWHFGIGGFVIIHNRRLGVDFHIKDTWLDILGAISNWGTLALGLGVFVP